MTRARAIVLLLTIGMGMLHGSAMESPALRRDSAGNSIALWWQAPNTGNSVVQEAYRPSGGNWAVPTVISDVSMGASFPTLAVNTLTGDAVAMWLVDDPVHYVTCIMASMRPFNGSWTTPVTVSSAGSNCESDIQLTIDVSGEIVAVWTGTLSGDMNTVTRSSTALFGGSWTAPETISTVFTQKKKMSRRRRRRR